MNYFECCQICTIKRHPGCSAHCGEYKDARIELNRINALRREANECRITTDSMIKHQNDNLHYRQKCMKGYLR